MTPLLADDFASIAFELKRIEAEKVPPEKQEEYSWATVLNHVAPDYDGA